MHDPHDVRSPKRKNKNGTQAELVLPLLVKDYNIYKDGVCDRKKNQMAQFHHI